MRRKLPWVLLFALAMGWFEASVVVYLRTLFYPEGFAFPLHYVLPPHVDETLITLVELIREAASILMIIAVAWLAAGFSREKSVLRWERFAWVCLIFGVWDIVYYLALRLTIGWPASLADWDILFLLPLPWVGPVWAPVLIAASLIASALVILSLLERGVPLNIPRWLWAAEVVAGLVCIGTFVYNWRCVIELGMPLPFPAWLFLLGWGTGVAGFVWGVRRVGK